MILGNAFRLVASALGASAIISWQKGGSISLTATLALVSLSLLTVGIVIKRVEMEDPSQG